MDWSLFGCARTGHVTYAPDEPGLAGPADGADRRRDGVAVPALRRVRDRRAARQRPGRGGAAAPPGQRTARRTAPAQLRADRRMHAQPPGPALPATCRVQSQAAYPADTHTMTAAACAS